MKVKEFVEGYNKIAIENLKKKYITDNIEVNSYISFVDKSSLCQRVINATTFEYDEDGKRTENISINSVSRFLIFTMSVIDVYTNLEVDMNNVTKEYDLLNENGLIELFINSDPNGSSIIPLKEYSEMQAILNMTLDDTLQNNMSTQAFIQNQVTRFGTLIGTTLSPIMDKLADVVAGMDEKTIDKLGSKIEKLLKKVN